MQLDILPGIAYQTDDRRQVRQPEAGGAIRTNMLITAGMIEGATLFAIVLCLLLKFIK